LARIERGEGLPDNNSKIRLLEWLGPEGEQAGLGFDQRIRALSRGEDRALAHRAWLTDRVVPTIKWKKIMRSTLLPPRCFRAFNGRLRLSSADFDGYREDVWHLARTRRLPHQEAGPLARTHRQASRAVVGVEAGRAGR